MLTNHWTPGAIEADVDIATRWWSDYPIRDYNRLTRATQLHDEMVQEVFHKPKKLARSASASRYEGIKDVQFDFPIRRAPSVSDYCPSHALPASDRYVDTFVPTYRAFEPKFKSSYYHSTLSPWKTKELLRDVARPPKARKPEVYAPIVRYSYLPEQQLRTRSAFYNKLYAPPSYMDTAANLLSTAVGSKLRSIGYSLPFVWTTFDQGPLYVSPFDRHVRSGRILYSRLEHPPTIRKTHYRSIAPTYAFKPSIGINRSHRF